MTILTNKVSIFLQDVFCVGNKWRQLTIFFYTANGQSNCGKCSYVKIHWVKPGSIKGVLHSWNRDGNAGTKEDRWKIVPACKWWTVWKERNQRCFEDKQSGLQMFKMNRLSLYYFWCKQNVLAQAEDIFDVLDYLSKATCGYGARYVVRNTFEGELHALM